MRRTTALLVTTAILASACASRVDDSEFALSAIRSDAEGVSTSTTTVEVDGTGGTSPGAVTGSTGTAGPAGTAQPQTDSGPQTTGGPPATGQGAGDSGGSATPGSAGGNTGSAPSDAASTPTTSGGDPANAPSVNRNSDVGVTDTQIKVGNIVSEGGALGPDQFTPSYYGANAYFELLNAQGGINGRTIDYQTCDDAEDAGKNVECAQRLVENEQVFALVATNTRKYAGAEYISNQGVPDVGGQPIGNEYYTYPTLYTILGSEYERDGQPGNDGKLWRDTATYDYYATTLNIQKAAVFYYSIPISKQEGLNVVKQLNLLGVPTVEYEINPALPNFDARVADMESAGVDSIFDTMDVNANRNLCNAMQRAEFSVIAKGTTVAGNTRTIGVDFPTVCRDAMYATGEWEPLGSDHPEAQLFRQTMSTVYRGRFDASLHQWAWEGWIAAKLFHEVVESLGDNVTREGVREWLDTTVDWTADGLGTKQVWHAYDLENNPPVRCFYVSKWNDETKFFEEVASGQTNCPEDTKWFSFDPQ